MEIGCLIFLLNKIKKSLSISETSKIIDTLTFTVIIIMIAIFLFVINTINFLKLI